MSTPEQLAVVQGWLDGIAYKPGTSFEAVLENNPVAPGSSVIKVFINALLFDSTHPQHTKVVRNRSIRVAVPVRMPIGGFEDTDVIDHPWYELGPDLVGGPLIRVGKGSTMPFHLELKPTEENLWEFLRWLRVELHDLEYHESDEWFRNKDTGQVFFDPHKT